MSTPKQTSKQRSGQPDTNQGKPTIEQDNPDENAGQRDRTQSGEPGGKPGGKPTLDDERGGKPTLDDDNRGKNYGQREGSTISEDNDVE